MKNSKRLLHGSLAVLTGSVLCLCPAALGQSRAKKFDVNGSGGLDADERIAAARHAASNVIRATDTNFDGVPDLVTAEDFPGLPEIEAQRQAFLVNSRLADQDLARTEVEQEFLTRRLGLNNAAGDNEEVTLDAADNQLRTSPIEPSAEPGPAPVNEAASGRSFLSDIRVRGDESQLMVPSQDAKGALISYARDFDTDAELWQLRGIIGAVPRPITGTADDSPLWAPFVQVDRSTNSQDSSKETNLLAAKLFLAGTFPLGERLKGDARGYIRASPYYATDFDFDSSIAGIEAAGGLIVPEAGIGRRIAVPGTRKSLSLLWLPELRTGYRYVFDNGDNDELESDEASAFLGAGVSVSLRPMSADWRDRLELTFSYEHVSDIVNDWDGNDLFSSSLSYDFTGTGNLLLAVTYRAGRISITEEDVNTLSLGLNLRF